MFDAKDEIRVFAVLLLVNLVRLLFVRPRPQPLPWLRRALSGLWEGLKQTGSNPYLFLLFWVVLGQAVGWVGVLMTLGWDSLTRTQTGQGP